MTLERMRGPYVKLRKRLERAGYGYLAGAGDEPDVFLYLNPKNGKELWLVRVHERGDWFTITKKRPPIRHGHS
ncbi:MAG: hypothetical protein KGI38_11385 [Thaumarchaeota archaeon]|nr:hypothetical protein [Nitrososphaerota archaeon]